MENENNPPESEEIERAWVEEIKRRAAQIDSGEVRPIPADEVFQKLRVMISSTNDVPER